MIMLRRRGLMAEKVAVSSCVKKSLIAFAASFSQRESNGAVRKFLTDGSGDCCHAPVMKPGVFSALENKGAKSQSIPMTAAFQNLFLSQPVPLCFFVAAADSAVIAVVFAEAADFNQTADKNLSFVKGSALKSCLLLQISRNLFISPG